MWYTILRRKGGTSYFERWVCRLFMCFWISYNNAALVSPPFKKFLILLDNRVSFP